MYKIPSKFLKNTVIICPYLPPKSLKHFGIDMLQRVGPFSMGTNKDFTLIVTGIGAGLVMDAVLSLKESKSKCIMFWGSCGSLNKKEFNIGSIVTPKLAYSFDSCSRALLNKTAPISKSMPNKKPYNQLIMRNNNDIQACTLASFPSINLENQFKKVFLSKNCNVVDMECAIFFQTSQKINKKAVALLYVTDIIDKKSLFDKNIYSDGNVRNSIIKSAGILCDVARESNL